jgi:hypothetical protein
MAWDYPEGLLVPVLGIDTHTVVGWPADLTARGETINWPLGDGDGVVPKESAAYLPGVPNFPLSKVEHTDLANDWRLLNRLKDLCRNGLPQSLPILLPELPDGPPPVPQMVTPGTWSYAYYLLKDP